VAQWIIIHRSRNGKALMRRRGISARLKAHLEQLLPELEAQAIAEGFAVHSPGWRPYPDRDRGRLTFGQVAAMENGRLVVEHVPPAPARKDMPLPKPPDPSSGEMLAAVESALAAEMCTTDSLPTTEAGADEHLADGRCRSVTRR
jgi:hypothetical protein